MSPILAFQKNRLISSLGLWLKVWDPATLTLTLSIVNTPAKVIQPFEAEFSPISHGLRLTPDGYS
jgi:hypothetical protein